MSRTLRRSRRACSALAVAGLLAACGSAGSESSRLVPQSRVPQAADADPVATLTGGRAAEAFGAFSYRTAADGTVEPDADWVRENIRTAELPVVGRVTCHRVMLERLRGALAEVEASRLAGTLTTYDGCYVPRFIASDPARPLSLHTWGVAVDLDAATNQRGVAGTMHPQVVEIFKRWGFRWGGDWRHTDPMHFELGASLDV